MLKTITQREISPSESNWEAPGDSGNADPSGGRSPDEFDTEQGEHPDGLELYFFSSKICGDQLMDDERRRIAAHIKTCAECVAIQMAIEEYFHKEVIEKGDQFIHKVIYKVQEWVARGIFEMTDPNHKLTIDVRQSFGASSIYSLSPDYLHRALIGSDA